jgi:hypothetical protein
VCRDCKFYFHAADECRAHPPTIFNTEESFWPEVEPNDFCGEWQSKSSALNSFGNPQQ